MTWVDRIPPVGTTHANDTYTIYYGVKDGRFIRWHGGSTEALARKEAAKTLDADRNAKAGGIYRFISATIVRTRIEDTVAAHIPLEVKT